MKILTNLFKFSFIALGWTVFILLSYVAFKDEKAGKIVIDPSSITKVSIGMGKNKKVDINNIVLVAKK